VALHWLGGPKALKYVLAGFDRVDGTYWHVLASEVGEMNDPTAIEPLKNILARVKSAPTGRYPPATAPTIARVIHDLQRIAGDTASATQTMLSTGGSGLRVQARPTNAVTNDQWYFGPVAGFYNDKTNATLTAANGTKSDWGGQWRECR
jgi:hypothetical protein